MDQPGRVANPARGQLNRENYIPLSPFAPEKLVSRDWFGSSVPMAYGERRKVENRSTVANCPLKGGK